MTDQADASPPGGSPPRAPAGESRAARVTLLRRALQAGAALLLIACAAQVTLRGFSTPAPSPSASGPSKMLSPKFSGTSKDGRTYSLTGREGMADPKDAKLILIDQPALVLRTKSRKVTKMTAKTGVYDEAANTLLLKGDVRVDDGAGSRFSSQRAVINTTTGAVSGQSGLRVQGSAVDLQSQDYTVLEEGDRMILRGGVRGRLNPQN